MKRSYSDVESDGDDVFDDDSLKAGSPSGQSCQVTDRKKRRGIIEKRRRDRINSSLTELRRLVPSAFEKQGSAKLEKAEILQMAVDHLKMLHQKGINSYNFDPHALATDYRSVGYRECAAEVARYLVAVEGLDIQDPLRMRLLSHLQCYSAQREAAKAAMPNSSWPPMSYGGYNSQYSGSAIPPMGGVLQSQHTSQQEHVMTSQPQTGVPSTASFVDTRLNQSDSSLHSHMRLQSSGSHVSSMNGSASQVSQISPPLLSSFPQLHSQFPVSLTANSVMAQNMPPIYNPSTTTAGNHNGVKPYRPWGAEFAY
ncbi:hairy/enhancer-of-split related with YRPW motif protein 1 [Patella vulgata]|uniref:hairy/enhancer-of-split related with YRPW motif protein 1 n=1 Tax=Patella vulgata TaxID=6465 RepID=UPI00217FFCCB|nr:hairy/enhancer-of-split related with YRPW motif protein 1 [Patella vulgata]